MQRVQTDRAPVAGAYSAGVINAGLLFTAGQIGRDPRDGALGRDTSAQLDQCLERLDAVCEAAGVALQNAIRATVYLTHLARDRDHVDRAFADRFGDHPPARTTVGVAELPGGALVEVDLIVAVPGLR